jgi:hypothetical protein
MPRWGKAEARVIETVNREREITGKGGVLLAGPG